MGYPGAKIEMKKLIVLFVLFPVLCFSQNDTVCEAANNLVGLGAKLADSKQWVEAIKRYTLATQICPSNALAFHNRAIAKQNMEDFKSAAMDYIEALKLNTNGNDTNADSYYGLGMCLFMLNERVKACKAFSKAGELGNATAYEIIKKYCK